MHKSPSNKVYIGITSKSVKERWCGKTNAYMNNPYFCKAILKYGWDNFEHIILFKDLNKISAELIEIDLIYYYKKQNLCYNITDGGEGNLGLRHDDAFKERLRKRSIGNTYGAHPCSEETKKKIRKATGKTVIEYNKDTQEIINTYDSCHEAADAIGGVFQSVSKACLSGKPYKNKYFKYV